MKAAFLIKNGKAEDAFEIREAETPVPKQGEVLVEVEAFGLNFADVMARLGHYPDAPPLPAILGYDVVGRIAELGPGVAHLQKGQRVVALTRFGGYATHAIADARAVAPVDEHMDPGIATALATQACTAIYCAEEMVNMHAGDHVLVHAAAGGVGTLLVQLALHRECIVYGTAGTEAKLQYLREMGVQHPINYRKKDFAVEVAKIRGKEGLDIIFDPVGGKSIKKGFRLLGAGGRIVSFGASSLTSTRSFFGKVRVGVGFGIYHPVAFVSNSKSMLGVNLLRLADHRPQVIQRVMQQAVAHAQQGILKPRVGGMFPSNQLAGAHHFLESRQSMGKVVVKWE
ncbi:MAG: alcohol dehydrogenase [Bacteroidetes bacterium]|nr:MAG: alcohol dehydrogenase [Bacteroidota bacterium]